MTDIRPGWDRTWLDVAGVIAKRSLCNNSRVGAVVVTGEQRLNSTGYNGPPRGMQVKGPCKGWCPRGKDRTGRGTADYSSCVSIHAEVNALLRADATQISGGTMYVTRAPCINCARIIANSGLAKVVCEQNDEDDKDRAAEVFVYLYDCDIEVTYNDGSWA